MTRQKCQRRTTHNQHTLGGADADALSTQPLTLITHSGTLLVLSTLALTNPKRAFYSCTNKLTTLLN